MTSPSQGAFSYKNPYHRYLHCAVFFLIVASIKLTVLYVVAAKQKKVVGGLKFYNY